MFSHSLPLGDLTVEQFLAEYWQKKPLLVRRALPHVSPPLSPEELAGLACEEEVESRLVIHDGRTEKWELSYGPFREETFRTLPQNHWTLLVQAVDYWVPAAAEFLDQFTFIPSWRLDDLMISLSGEGGGVGPHFDHYDVFLIQVSGRRQWEIGGICDEHAPRRLDTPLLILSDWHPTERWILDPGDLLYLPPRIGHSGIALSHQCMTCSVGFRAPSHSEMLREFANFIDCELGEERRYADPDLSLQPNPGLIPRDALNKVSNILRQYVSDRKKIAEWFGCYVTIPKYQEEASSLKEYSLEDVQTTYSHGGILVRNEGSRFAYQDHGKEVWLFVDGRHFRCSKTHAGFVRHLCTSRVISHKDVACGHENLCLLQQLLNQGSLYWKE